MKEYIWSILDLKLIAKHLLLSVVLVTKSVGCVSPHKLSVDLSGSSCCLDSDLDERVESTRVLCF